MPRVLIRGFRAATLAKVLVLVVVGAVLIYQWPVERQLLTIDDDALTDLYASTLAQVSAEHEKIRMRIINDAGYSPERAARDLLAPPKFPKGNYTLSPSSEEYVKRLQWQLQVAMTDSPYLRELRASVEKVAKHQHPLISRFPPNLISTDKLAGSGIPDLFRMWAALLPLPLDESLSDLLPETEWAAPAREGAVWKVDVADDHRINTEMSKWIGESNIMYGNGVWPTKWKKMSSALRADIYRYMSMLFEGGVYADSDTSPIAHPYLWGIEARSVLHPDLEVVEKILKSHEVADASHRRVWEKRSPVEKEEKPEGKDAEAKGAEVQAESKEKKEVKEDKKEESKKDAGAEDKKEESKKDAGAEDCDEKDKDGKCAPPKKSTLPKGQKHIPVYHGHRRTDVRGPPYDQTSLLSPDINVVVSVAWDSESTIKLRRWTQWSFGLLKDSARQSDYGRSLQFERYVIAAKPFHPIFLDTVTTIVDMVDAEGASENERLDAMSLSGTGVFSDAVFRYLLVRYGVTPDKLRGIRGPVRVGDVLILQEGAFQAPEFAIDRMIEYIRQYFPMLPGSGSVKYIPGENLWYWGAGYETWKTGGRQLVFHGISDRWKDDVDKQETEWEEEE